PDLILVQDTLDPAPIRHQPGPRPILQGQRVHLEHMTHHHPRIAASPQPRRFRRNRPGPAPAAAKKTAQIVEADLRLAKPPPPPQKKRPRWLHPVARSPTPRTPPPLSWFKSRTIPYPTPLPGTPPTSPLPRFTATPSAAPPAQASPSSSWPRSNRTG